MRRIYLPKTGLAVFMGQRKILVFVRVYDSSHKCADVFINRDNIIT